MNKQPLIDRNSRNLDSFSEKDDNEKFPKLKANYTDIDDSKTDHFYDSNWFSHISFAWVYTVLKVYSINKKREQRIQSLTLIH